MSSLSQEREVVLLASELGLKPFDPIAEIIDYCLARIERWVAEDGPIASLAHLEQVVCKRLKLCFEEVWSDDDLDQIIRKYVALGDFVFATLRTDLDESTFATVFSRSNPRPGDEYYYVAVIDCRGDKAHRRFFTRWHEIAHVLTLKRPPVSPVRRSTSERPPLERLMDTIAAKIGFYDPIFRPAVDAEVTASGGLTLAGAERIRNRMCPNASFQATLTACVERASTPLLSVYAGMGYKKAEEAVLNSNQLQLFPLDKPEPKLRALRATRNDSAKATDLRIDANMQVPEESLVASYFHETDGRDTAPDAAGTENLAIWRHSDGSSVSEADVYIEVRRSGDQVIALIQPATGGIG